ncbi:MAG: ATP-grasp domain-containing protein [Patescibacteria group bacterium]|nr:ATP-grasp domain-containing protein [Patescibacteria group bacterium]
MIGLKIASFESLEYLFSNNKGNYYCITFDESACGDLVKKNYSDNKIINIDLPSSKAWSDEKKVVSKTDLADLLRKKGVDSLVLDTHSSTYIEKWAEKQGIGLVVTPWKIQKKIENKIFFQKFLEKNSLPSPKSWILRNEKDVDFADTFPVIVQIPDSNGSKGTFFAKNRSEIKKLINSEKAPLPLLCRQFIDNGLPIGVSVLIGPEKMVFSGLRVQAYFLNANGTSVYYGIQWVKTSYFSKSVIKKLNSYLEKAGKALQELGFIGVANFDIIIRNNEIYFIECNPRLGGSTPQISFKKELLHGLNFGNEFAKVTCGGELSLNKRFIPDTSYQGFNLDLDFLADGHIDTEINTAKVGFYQPVSGGFVYASSKASDFEDDAIFIYHANPEKITISHNYFMGFSMTHRPLLNLRKNGYTFSVEGKKFLKQIENLIIGNDK